MIPLRWTAFLVVAVEAALFAAATRDWVVPGAVILLTLVGAIHVWDVDCPQRRRSALVVVLAIAVAALYFLMPYERPVPQSPRLSLANPESFTGVNYGASVGIFRFPRIAHAAGQFALLFQASQLYIRPRFREHEPRWLRGAWGLGPIFPFLGLVVLITAGDLTATPTVHTIFQVFSLLFATTIALYLVTYSAARQAAAQRIPLRAWFGGVAVLAVALAIGWGGSTAILRYGTQMDQILGRMLVTNIPGESVGFSTATTLQSMANLRANDNGIALRVYSSKAPGYLRGKAYDTLQGNRWVTSATPRHLQPSADIGPVEGPGNAVFIVGEGQVENSARMEVWPAAMLPGVYFHPLSTWAVVASAKSVDRDSLGNLRSAGGGSNVYSALISADFAGNDPAQPLRDKLTALPKRLDPRVQELAGAVMADCDSVRDAIHCVEAYFSGAYEYKLAIQVPPNVDPLSYFLLEKPAAHCEYFASGATVLLRSRGIPARYVTGYLVTEKNEFGDYWVARNSQAHAWCEAYVPGAGWVTVEATPAGGLPTADSRSLYELLKDYLGHIWQVVKRAVSTWEFAAFGTTNLMRLLIPLAIVAGLGFLGTVLYRLRRLWRGRAARKAEATTPTEREANRMLRALLDRQDRAVGETGLTRNRAETLADFAKRVESAGIDEKAKWYRDYESIRFRVVVAPGSIDELAERLDN